MEQSSGLPTIEIPGEVPWRNTTLSAAEFVHQIRSSVLLYRPPLWKRLLAGAQTSHSQPASVTEAIALMGELETLTTSQSLSPEQRERWVWLCRRIKQVAKGRLLNDQAQTYLDLLLADGLTQLSPRSEPDGGSSEANDVEALALFDASLEKLDARKFPDLCMYAQAEKAVTLFALSAATEGKTKIERLVASTKCLDVAIDLCSRERLPEVWVTLRLMRVFQLMGYYLTRVGSDRLKTLRKAMNDCDELIHHISDDADHNVWIISHVLKGDMLQLLGMEVPATYKAAVYRDLVHTMDALIAAYEQDENQTAIASHKLTRANALSELYYLGALPATQSTQVTLTALRDYDAAIAGIPRELDAEHWAMAHYFKGKLLQSIQWIDFSRFDGKHAGRLREAIDSFDQALSVITEDSNPGLFAAISDYKGSTLGQLARVPERYPYEHDSLTEGQRVELYEQAVACFDMALRGYGTTQSPIACAIMLNNKGNALRNMALLLESTGALEMLQHAIACYDEALKVHEQEKDDTNLRRTLANKQSAINAMDMVAGRLETSDVIVISEIVRARLIRSLADKRNHDEITEHPAGLPDMANVRAGKVSEYYFDLPDVAKVRDTMKALVSGEDAEHLGLIIMGKPKSGKTTLAMEVLESAAPDFYLLIWMPAFLHPELSALRPLRGKKVVLFIEWLGMFMKYEDEASELQRAIAMLREICSRLVVVATGDVSDGTTPASQVFGELADRFIETEMRPLSPLDPDTIEAPHTMDIASRAADGSWRVNEQTSKELNLQQRIASLRADDVPVGARCLLQAIWLLRSVGLRQSEEVWLEVVAREVFNLNKEQDPWESAKAWLIEHAWILQEIDPVSGKILLVPRDSSYVDTAIPEVFPASPLDKMRYLSKLTTLFSNDPVYVDGLAAISDAAFKLHDLPDQANGLRWEILIQSLERILPHLTGSQAPTLAQRHAMLGRAYSQRTSGDEVDNLQAAVREYQNGIDACSVDDDQYRSTLQWSLASAHARLAIETQGDTQHSHLADAIKYYKAALEVRTKTSAPEDWSQINASLGMLLSRISHDDPANTEMAIEALNAALSLMAPERDRREWAMINLLLGFQYLNRASESYKSNAPLNNDLDNMRKALSDALTVYDFETSPYLWATAHVMLANTYQLELTPRFKTFTGFDATTELLCRSLLKECSNALSVLTYEIAPDSWIKIKLAQCQAYLLMAAVDQADQMTNVDLACESAEQALDHVTRETSPEQWEDLQRLHAIAIMQRAVARQDLYDDGDKEIMDAIKAVSTVLDMPSHSDKPNEQALLYFLLGQGYALLEEGDEADNLERAIEALEAALSAVDRDAAPLFWASVCSSSVLCYRDRIRGSHRENLEIAAAKCRAALSVITQSVDVNQWTVLTQVLEQIEDNLNTQ